MSSFAWRVGSVGVVLVIHFTASVLNAGNALTPGELIVEPPTLICLGFEWPVEGDDNRNAACDLAYRAKGGSEWKHAFPMLRIKGEVMGRGEESMQWTAPNMLAGSIVDLQPDTEYEIKLTLNDPDGVQGDGAAAGSVERILVARTRPEPRAFEKGRSLHVYPDNHKGTKEKLAFNDLGSAYEQARPGDQILIHAGTYTVAESAKRERTDYIFDKPATAEKPIVIRGAGDGEAILDGDGALILIECGKSRYHYIEDLTLQGADHLIYAGRDDEGAVGLVVRRCKLQDAGFPIITQSGHCRDFYIADNTFTGPNQIWQPRDESSEKFGASHAIWLMGQGHVVCFNRITGYWDGVDYTGGKPPAARKLQNSAGDIYNNELSRFADDAIEMDYGVHNIRVMRNFIYDTFIGISFQPLYGGPGYVYRNIVYNCTRAPIKPNQWPAGLMIFNNTFISADSAGRWASMWQNTRIMNNLFMGKDGGAGVIWTGTPTPKTSILDYNGWRMHAVSEQGPVYFSFPEPIPVPTGSHPSGECVYVSFEQFVEHTGHEKHAVIVDYDVFEKFQPPSGAMGSLPELDLRLKPGSAALDRGAVLPNFTDAATGAAPDLGAHELGQPMPHYGPRE